MSDFNLKNSQELSDLNDLKKNYICLISSEQTRFHVPINILYISNLISCMLENIDNENLEDDRDIPLLNVNAKCVAKIIEFMQYYHNDKMKDIEKPLRSSNLKDIIQDWYAEFINIDEDFLFSLINAANYMDIQPLLNLGCAKVASLIKNKTPEEIRNIFNIDDKNNIQNNIGEIENKND